MKQNTHTHTHRGTKNISIIKNATVTTMNNQPLQKVTKSLYIVTHLGQLPFMLITEMARTWAIKEDSVNTSIIHWYSTLPRNGRIHGLSKNTGINKGSRTGRFCSSRQDPKAEDRTGRVGRAEADRQ